MQFLYFLENLRVPGLNEFFLLITKLGEETAFLALALVFFWCVDKSGRIGANAFARIPFFSSSFG